MRSGRRLLLATITTIATPACSRFCWYRTQVLVGGEKDSELCVLHFLEQLTVFGSCPAHFGNGFDFVLGELSF